MEHLILLTHEIGDSVEKARRLEANGMDLWDQLKKQTAEYVAAVHHAGQKFTGETLMHIINGNIGRH